MTECNDPNCRCESWPPTECPQCDMVAVGFTPEDWWKHFDGPCETLGKLYCFVDKPENGVKA